MTWREVWTSLEPEERRRAARALLAEDAESAGARNRALDYLASALRFRRRRLQALPLDRKADYLARAMAPPVPVVEDALTALHFAERRAMLVFFLDALGVPHASGAMAAGPTGRAPPGADEVRAATAALLDRFPAGHVALYLRGLRLQDPVFWAAIAATPVPSPGPAAPPAAEADGAGARLPALEEQSLEGAAPEFVAGVEFDTLDRVLIRSIVESVGAVDGALDEDQVRDLVDGVLHLNLERTSACFHLGFLDVLQDRTPGLDAPEASEDRRNWYLAGALCGILRGGVAARAAAFVRDHAEAFRAMGAGRHAAASLVVPLLIDVHRDTGDVVAAAEFLRPGGLAAAGHGVVQRLVDETAALLAARRAEEARRLLTLAEQACALRTERGDPPPAELDEDIGRRLAHAWRLGGTFDRAQERLEGLLLTGTPARRAMVLADLGIVACRLRALEEVRLPAEKAALGEVARALEPGLGRFGEAAASSSRPGGHGEYCLAVHHLAEGRTAEALPLLETAVAEMEMRPQAYARGGLLPRSRLYLAYAIAEQGIVARTDHVVSLVRQAVAAVGLEAPWMLREILTDLALQDEARAAQLARSLRDELGPQVLDAVADAQLLRHLPQAREDLLDRAALATRARGDRFSDYERALTAALHAHDEDMARDALDGLESLSDAEPESTRFLAVLDAPGRIGSLWDEDDVDLSRARILGMRGEVKGAAAALMRLGHRLATRQAPHHLLAAEGLVERVRGLGGDPDEALLARLRAARSSEEPPPPSGAARGGVYFLGGNETQIQYADRLRAWARERWPGVELVLDAPGWSSNWGRERETYARRIRSAQAVVLMAFVRTGLGHWARRICGQAGVPWVPCTGHGLSAMQGAIERAVALLPRR